MKDFEPHWSCSRERLGQGGQAHTYLVYEVAEPHRRGAAKRLTDKAREDRFRREIEAYKRIDHPNVLKVLDEGTASKGRPYLVSEYCELGELKPTAFVGLNTLERLGLFRQICEGVAAAHRIGIVHRDIKPENILLKANLVPVVADFGICYLIDRGNTDPRITEADRAMASRYFGAPEARDGRVENVQPAADVYSLGKLLYWLMSGGRTFDREDHRRPEYALYRDDPSNPEQELITRLLDQTITKEPGTRLASAPDVLFHLDALVEVIRAGGRAVGVNTPQRCLFCARGQYLPVANGVTEFHQDARSVADKLGFRLQEPHPRILIMVCDFCGNMQVFRPDLPEPRRGMPGDLRQQNERIARWKDISRANP